MDDISARFTETCQRDKAGVVSFTHGPADRAALKGKRVLITGGASGLGEAFARMFVDAGAHVIIADLNAASGEALVQELSVRSPEIVVKFFAVDIARWESQVSMFANVLRAVPGGQIDVLITSAGLGPRSWDFSAASPNELFAAADRQDTSLPAPSMACSDVGFCGTVYSIQLALKYAMGLHDASKTQPGEPVSKSIIILGSVASFRAMPISVDYTAVKWATRGLFRSMRLQAQHLGVRINMLAPTFISTPMTLQSVPQLERAGAKFGSIEDVVEVVARMTTDSRMNGRALSVTVQGPIDMCDDVDGMDGATTLRALTHSGAMSVPRSATMS